MYNIQEIEKKWQKYWEENKTFKVENDFSKSKYYCLDMFPFPSGAGLHVGHPEGMTANDIVSRYKNAKGFNVLHPIGWDAFGLPAENYAIKNGTHPKITTKQNIDNFRKQIKSLGFSYDWDREVDTTDPEYYKWTQWIFLKMFEKGLAYEQDLPINYCPSCKTGLANEEVLNDFSCERCGETVVKKKIRQWVLAITKYADRLLTDIDKLDWPEGLKDMQRNWIGKSEGCEFEMLAVKNKAQKNENGSSKGSCLNDKAKFSYASIIYENTEKVKKKNTKTLLENINEKVSYKNKEIIFNGKSINKHFNSKNNKDIRIRKKLAHTISGNLNNLYFIENNIGYLKFNDLIIKIILGEQSNGNYFVKTYYIDNKLTKLYQKYLGKISVYTTRIDTVFGMTYAVLAPDHKDVQNFITDENKEICEKYITDSSKKSDQDRTQADKEKTGVFTGSYVINPFNGKEVPLWIGDYVLGNYGTGAVMAVPAHDERDFEFAKKYDLEIIESISGGKISEKAFTGLGILTNSGDFSGLESIEAQSKMIEFAEKNGFGSKKINYKLRDWLFSRQRYWGDPIPLIHLENDNIEKLDKIKDKKNKDYHIPQEGVTHNGDTAKSLYVHIILENITKVKKKRNKIHFFKLKSIVKTKKGDIIFDGQSLQEHFYLKNIKEQKRRKEFGTTIIENLNNIQYESELLGYINIGNKIFRIILEKVENKYNVKTYYLVQKYTKIFNKAYIKEKNDGNYLMIKGQEFSKIYDGIYGKIVGDNNLPIKLPEVEKFEPSGDGQSPLANVESFVNIQLADNLVGKRETNTMPQWGGSCWYYLRYMNPDNKDMLVDPEVEKYWGQVDSYVGGAEHAVLHLLYARFWHKFLFDIGVVSTDEPFYRLRNQGLITAHSYENSKGKLIANDLVEEKDGKFFDKESGEELKKVIAKMSKSLKNVINPDKIVAEYGADTLRLYEMYMADFKDSAPWDTKNIIGVKRFLEKVERAFNSIEGKFAENDKEAIKILNKTIRKVEEDIENYKFNTAIAQMMILVNYGRPTDEKLFIEWKEKFVVILSAFAPFLAEELYSELCRDVSLKHLNKINKKDLSEKGLYKYNSVFFAKWPEVDESLLIESTVKIAVQVLGKVRGTIEINKDESKESVLEKARNNSDVAKWLEGKNLVKEIYVPGKIVNLVVN